MKNNNNDDDIIEAVITGPPKEVVQQGRVTLTTEELITVQIPIVGGKYANKVPPLTDNQLEELRQSLKRDGFLPKYPIVVNRKGDVLDGHHRLKLCKELGISSPAVGLQEFDSELEEELFVLRINRARRQLNEWQSLELALQEKPLLARLAERNMKAGKTLSRNQERVHVDKELSKKYGLSKDKLYKADQVLKAVEKEPDRKLGVDYDGRYRGESGPTYSELLRDARADNIKPSKAYNIIKYDQGIIRKREEAASSAKSLKLPSKVLLLNADCTKEIPELKDGSVDLIVTDPPYMRENVAMFDELAKFAVRKLMEGGSLVFFYGQYQQPQIHEIFRKYEHQLTWWWNFCVNHEGSYGTQMYTRGVFVDWKPMLWFVKGGKRLTTNVISDYIQSKKPDKSKHPWAQSSIEAEYLIKNLTVSEDSLVVDPFLGSGAFAIPAIKLGRYFIGIELDKEVFENARNNIAISCNCI